MKVLAVNNEISYKAAEVQTKNLAAENKDKKDNTKKIVLCALSFISY